MGGFAAIFNRDGAPVAAEALDRMLSRIAYRGRDGLGRSIEGPVALGYAAFHTTPESIRENQPHRDETGSIVVTFDGRVDNREELTAALTDAGAVLRDDTDVEIVLRAYLEWGEEAPLKIIGDFAMVVWDGRNRRLFCARDAFGMRPFYYHLSAKTFICGSELRQVLDASGIVRKPNEAMMAEYMIGEVSTCDETLFKGIMRLCPGHTMIIGTDQFVVRKYYDADFSKPIHYRTDDEYAEHFLALMKEAVRVRMRAVGGVVSDLSGGLDSTSIVALAHELIANGAIPPVPFETLTNDFTEPQADERSYVNAAVAMMNLRANRQPPLIVERENYEEQARFYLDLPDSPINWAIVPLMREVAERGFRVALNGLGGDEWFAGSSLYFADLLKGLRFMTLIRGLRASAARLRADGQRYSYIRQGLSFAVLPVLSVRTATLIRKVFRRDTAPAMAFVARFSERVRRDSMPTMENKPLRDATLLQNANRGWLTDGWRIFSLEMNERFGMALGLEYRAPFYDRRLVEFALNIPEEQRHGPNPSKFVLRNAMKGRIPEIVRTRTDKGDFTVKYMQEYERFGGVDFLRSLSMAQAGWIVPEVLERMYRETGEFVKNGATSRRSYIWPLFGLIMIDMWHQAAFHES